jgi:PAS domain S-box-containing protein
MHRSTRGVDTLVSTRPDRSGELELDALRPVAQRAGRLAEALFGAIEADVVIVHNGRVWRGKTGNERTDDDAAAQIAMAGDGIFWVEDTHEHPIWREHPQTRGPCGIRFCAVAAIRLKSGFRLGALRVFDTHPRAFDEALAARLQDLAAFVAAECDRVVSYETWMLRELFEQSPGFMAVFNGPDHVYEMVNPAYIALVGPRPMIGLPSRKVLPELAEQGVLDLLDEVAKSGRAKVGQGMSFTLSRKPGKPEKVVVDFVLQPIFDVAGNVSSIFLQGNDVTEEKRAIDELRASQAKLEEALAANQAIFDNSLDVICAISSEGRFTQVSKHAADLWGYTPEELVGQPFMDLVHPQDVESTSAMHAQIVGGKQTVGFHNRYIHKNGTAIPIMWSAAWSERHNTVVAVARDMRESLDKEERLRRAQKMEAIGRLTGGVAHDFNNLLTIIIGGAEVLVQTLEPGTEAHDIAKLALNAGERGADLVNRLLTFSRAQPLDPLALRVDTLFAAVEPLIQRTIGEHVRVEFKAQPGLTCVADRSQLESALLNLAINARDAMPAGGTLAIEAQSLELTADRATLLPPGAYVHLAVTDTGHGMDAQTLERAIEPFFTTKDVGKGTGLGLAMVYGFVQQSGGGMRIRSKPGKGTTVDIMLPAAASAPETDVIEQPAPPPGGGANILVVEDDDMVRSHIVRLLRSMGYNVVHSENGARALEIIQRRDDLDLLLTDVVMPEGMNGFQLAEQARVARPDLKVLFTSGYEEKQLADAGQDYSEDDLLRKPYRSAELAERVAGVLARA